MEFNFESDVVEIIDDEFYICGTEVPVHQVLSDIAGGSSFTEVSEEYDIEESSIAQLIMDLSEMLR